ncbi:MAG: hypothetical protein V3T00_06815, partial [bacterium]
MEQRTEFNRSPSTSIPPLREAPAAIRWTDILAGRADPAATPEARFREFRFPAEHPSTLLRRLLTEN